VICYTTYVHMEVMPVEEERLLTVAEIADRLQVDEQTVRRWIRQGRLAAHNFGGKAGYRIQPSALAKFLEATLEGGPEGKSLAAA
jgi:excisionase family DNA binding protein